MVGTSLRPTAQVPPGTGPAAGPSGPRSGGRTSGTSSPLEDHSSQRSPAPGVARGPPPRRSGQPGPDAASPRRSAPPTSVCPDLASADAAIGKMVLTSSKASRDRASATPSATSHRAGPAGERGVTAVRRPAPGRPGAGAVAAARAADGSPRWWTSIQARPFRQPRGHEVGRRLGHAPSAHPGPGRELVLPAPVAPGGFVHPAPRWRSSCPRGVAVLVWHGYAPAGQARFSVGFCPCRRGPLLVRCHLRADPTSTISAPGSRTRAISPVTRSPGRRGRRAAGRPSTASTCSSSISPVSSR